MTTDDTSETEPGPDAEREAGSGPGIEAKSDGSTEQRSGEESADDGEAERASDDEGSASNDGESASNDETRATSDRESSDSRSLVAVLSYALRIAWKLLVLLGKVALAGTRLVAAVVRDDRNQRRARRWFLLEGNRWTLVAAMVASIFVGSLALGLTNVIGVRESSFVTTMFSTIIAGLFSFIPLVIAVNQLTVSRLFGTPDRLRERVDSVHEFRRRIEGLSADVDVSPTDPAAFLVVIARAMRDRGTALRTVAEEADDEDVGADLEEYAAGVVEQADRVTDDLRGSDPGVFGVLLPVMNENYSRRFTAARRLRVRADPLPETADELLEDLQSVFVSVDVTRQYFKIIYLQQELARLSRLLAYSGTTAFLTSTLVVMIYASGYPPAVSETALLVVVALSLAVAFSPLAILFAFVVRVATVVKRTSAPGAFTPKGERPTHAR